MNQVGHIFAKDARHFWPEIAVVLAVTALFAEVYPYTWTPHVVVPGVGAAGGDGFEGVAELAAALVPVSWWVLIVRLVQDESLVGDRQWWITKPYDWPQLLGAKVLFLVVFVALPLLLAQWVLLGRAGLGALGHLPGQGYDLLLLGMVLVTPVMALAAATSTFGKLVLTGLGILVALIAFLVLLAWHKADSFSIAIPETVAVLLPLAAAGVIVFTYARRRTVLTRWLLAALFVAGIGSAYLSDSARFIAEKYPAGAGLPLRLTLDPERAATANPAQPDGHEKRIDVMLPVTVAGLAPGETVNLDALQATVKAPEGQSWTSPWEPEYGNRLRAALSNATIVVRIDRAFLERVKGEPLQLDLHFAVTQLRALGTTQVAMQVHDFAVSDFGVCAPVPGFLTLYPAGIACRAALREPPVTLVTVRWSEDGCAGGPAPGSGIAGGGWTGGVLSEPADLNLAAVWSSHLDLSNNIDTDRANKPGVDPHRLLCPGTPLTFTRYALVRRTQYETTIPNFTVPNWQTTTAAD